MNRNAAIKLQNKCDKYIDEFELAVDNIILEALAKQINIKDFVNERRYSTFVLPKKLQDELLMKKWIEESLNKMCLDQCGKVLWEMLK